MHVNNQQELSCCRDGGAVLHNLNSEEAGCVCFGEN